MDEGKFKEDDRRELLSSPPVVALARIRYTEAANALLKAGLGLGDWLRASLFRPDIWHLLFGRFGTHALRKFPSNG